MNLGQATAGNHSPVMLVMQIFNLTNQAITGLTQGDFAIRHTINPTGSVLRKPDPVICPDCFLEIGNGLYRLAVQPQITGNPWQGGTYYTDIEVIVTPSNSVFALIPIEIPY